MTRPVENRIHPEWSDDDIAHVARLLAEGRSASEIGRELDRSRSAVIGIIHRRKELREMKERPRSTSHTKKLGTTYKTRSDKGTKRAARPAPVAKVKPVAEVVPLPAPVSPAAYDATCPGVTLLELTSKTCRWPLGDPREESFRFCGHVSLESRPYCAHHTERASQKIVCAEARAA